MSIAYLPDGRKSPKAKTRPKSATATPIPSCRICMIDDYISYVIEKNGS
jgi:hypothetical protein